MPAYFSVVGYGSSGKTTLIRGLIIELRKRGYKIAVVKHDPQDHGVVDKQGSDTDLFWEAGSETVILSSPTRATVFRRTAEEMSLDALLHLCGEVDLVILEGYKHRPYPRIVLWSGEEDLNLPGAAVLALVYKQENKGKVQKHSFAPDVPLICRSDCKRLADLLEQSLLDKRDKNS